MNTTELMVGDWVSLFQGNPDGSSCNVQVSYIGEYGEVGIEHCEEYTSANCGLLFPIPITVDFLVINNLERIATDYYDLDVYEANDGLWRVVYTNLECSGFDESVVVSSVHELQHFLRHLKIDIDMKEIEL